MLFHITHTHSYQTCHGHDEAKKAKMVQAMESVDELGIKLIGMYVDPPGHKFYILMEADTMEQIVGFFDPLLELGDADIHPVMDFQAALAVLKKD
tara:strand:+ start:247 stop:531 length:285 start_codon:yes stop_codon:yes gene_type:complete